MTWIDFKHNRKQLSWGYVQMIHLNLNKFKDLFSRTGSQAILNYKQKMDWRNSIQQQCWNNWQQHFMKRYIFKQIICCDSSRYRKMRKAMHFGTGHFIFTYGNYLIIWDFTVYSKTIFSSTDPVYKSSREYHYSSFPCNILTLQQRKRKVLWRC